jgi:hypothetical protein
MAQSATEDQWLSSASPARLISSVALKVDSPVVFATLLNTHSTADSSASSRASQKRERSDFISEH